MLGREESVGVQARADFSKLREELSRTLSNDGAATTTDADETAPSPPPPPPPPQQTIVPKPILASQVKIRVRVMARKDYEKAGPTGFNTGNGSVLLAV